MFVFGNGEAIVTVWRAFLTTISQHLELLQILFQIVFVVVFLQQLGLPLLASFCNGKKVFFSKNFIAFVLGGLVLFYLFFSSPSSPAPPHFLGQAAWAFSS
jgi:hypothetical protein